MNQLIIQQASLHLGLKEIEGTQNNQTIVGFAHDIGMSWINDDETPWCAIFVNWVLKKCGYQYLSSAGALSMLAIGSETIDPQPGDIVVFDRGAGKGHVGFFLGYSHLGNLFCLGGNQGNSVSITMFTRDKLKGIRRVAEIKALTIPDALLSKGMSGELVKQLQAILLYLNLYSLKIDGDFGDGTVSSIIAFQSKNGLSTTGSYDDKMRDKLFSLLNE